MKLLSNVTPDGSAPKGSVEEANNMKFKALTAMIQSLQNDTLPKRLEILTASIEGKLDLLKSKVKKESQKDSQKISEKVVSE